MSTTIDGVVTDLPVEELKDIQPEKVEIPQEPIPKKGQDAEPSKPADAPKVEKPVEAKTEVKPKEVEPKTEKSEKPRPIAKLLSKNHELSESLAKSEAEKASLQAELQKLSEKPASPKTDDDITALAEEIGVESSILSRIVELARKGLGPVELPPEVKLLVEKQQEQELITAESEAFDNRFTRLAKVLPEIADYKDRIEALAYSDDIASDGEPYADKELSEIYFQFVKPEVEAGKVSGEQGRGLKGIRSKVVDFEEIQQRDDPKDIQAMDDETFAKYNQWLDERNNKGAIVQKFK